MKESYYPYERRIGGKRGEMRKDCLFTTAVREKEGENRGKEKGR